VRIADWASERRINGKASTRSRRGSRINTGLAHCGGRTATATARLVIGCLRVLCGVDDMKVEKGVSLNEVRALMYLQVSVKIHIIGDIILDVHEPSSECFVQSLKF